MSTLSKFSKEALTSELARRKAIEVAAEGAKREAWADTVGSFLTIEMVNLFRPNHNRNSCSDEHTNNADLTSKGYPRCSRCYLLDAITERWVSSDMEIILKVEPRPKLT